MLDARERSCIRRVLILLFTAAACRGAGKSMQEHEACGAGLITTCQGRMAFTGPFLEIQLPTGLHQFPQYLSRKEALWGPVPTGTSSGVIED